MMPDYNERLVKLEQSYTDHKIHSERRFDKNDKDHKEILERLSDIEISLLTYRRVVYAVGTSAGALIGLFIHYWNWIINELGHG